MPKITYYEVHSYPNPNGRYRFFPIAGTDCFSTPRIEIFDIYTAYNKLSEEEKSKISFEDFAKSFKPDTTSQNPFRNLFPEEES